MILPNGQFRFVFTSACFDDAVAFYRDGLALPVDHRWDYGPGERGHVFLAGGGMIEVFDRIPGTDFTPLQGVGMLIQVPDADEAFKTAVARNLKVVQEPVNHPWGHRTFQLADPDGILVSLFSEIPA